jgi:hypothetical protein
LQSQQFLAHCRAARLARLFLTTLRVSLKGADTTFLATLVTDDAAARIGLTVQQSLANAELENKQTVMTKIKFFINFFLG